MRFRACIFIAAFAALTMATEASQAEAAAQQHVEGIWKAVVPQKAMKGEFGNLDPLGVAAGARIAADCSLNWVDPDDGKLYCFASGTSLEFFLDSPQQHLKQAREGWLKMGAAAS